MIKTKEWLKEMRLNYNLSQSSLAKATGLSVSSIANIEQGQRLGSPETWNKIVDYFKSLGYFDIRLSFDSEELLIRIKKDLLVYSYDTPCFLFYDYIDDSVCFYDYKIIDDNKISFNGDVNVMLSDLRSAEHYFLFQSSIV